MFQTKYCEPLAPAEPSVTQAALGGQWHWELLYNSHTGQLSRVGCKGAVRGRRQAKPLCHRSSLAATRDVSTAPAPNRLPGVPWYPQGTSTSPGCPYAHGVPAGTPTSRRGYCTQELCMGLRYIPHATAVSLHGSARMSRGGLMGPEWMCAAPVPLRAEGAKLQPSQGHHTPSDQEVCK